MHEDLTLDILEVYKSAHKIHREKAFGELLKKYGELELHDYNKIMDKLLKTSVLLESGERDTYIYTDAFDQLGTLRKKKIERDIKQGLKEKTERIKDWKERNWWVIGVLCFIGGWLFTKITTRYLPDNPPPSREDKIKSDTIILKTDTVYITRYISASDTTSNKK